MINNSHYLYTQSTQGFPIKCGQNSQFLDTIESPYLENSASSIPRARQRQNYNYLNVKDSSFDRLKLRQTFDVGSNIRLRDKFGKFDPQDSDYKVTINNAAIKENHGNNPKLNNSSTGNRIKQRTRSQFQNSQRTNTSISQRKLQLQNKVRSFQATVDKFKDQLQVSSKIGEQLHKIRQDRIQRQKEKEKIMLQYTKITNLQLAGSTVKTGKPYNYSAKKQSSYPYKDYRAAQKSKFDLNSIINNTNIPLLIQPTSPQLPLKKQSLWKKQMADRQNSRKYAHAVSKNTKNCLSQFVVGKNLGQGKFGAVYQVLHKPTNMIFALKKVPKSIIQEHMMIDQLILELKLQSYLEHINILQLYHFFDDSTHIYLVLEYMEQGTLYTQLRKHKKLQQKQVAKHIKQVTSAVQYLHVNSIAHRDIKPQNIVVTNGICKMCDFGWATVCEDRRKTYCGTFDYTPPEILEGVQYDFTVDLWCLGVLTYELLVGKAPFYQISRKQTRDKIINVQTTHIDYPKDLSRYAISFIQSLLRKNPDMRLSSKDLLQHPFLKQSRSN